MAGEEELSLRILICCCFVVWFNYTWMVLSFFVFDLAMFLLTEMRQGVDWKWVLRMISMTSRWKRRIMKRNKLWVKLFDSSGFSRLNLLIRFLLLCTLSRYNHGMVVYCFPRGIVCRAQLIASTSISPFLEIGSTCKPNSSVLAIPISQNSMLAAVHSLCCS